MGPIRRVRIIRRAATAAGVALLAQAALGCGDDGDSGGGTGGSTAGLCVGDARAASGCKVTWELLEPCPTLLSNATVELAVFEGGCPPDQSLHDGSTASAIFRSTFEPADAFPKVTGLAEKPYGFAFVARNAGCTVTAYGCTAADLTTISGIKTAVCNWSATAPQTACACTLLSGGGCPIPEKCETGGTCTGAVPP